MFKWMFTDCGDKGHILAFAGTESVSLHEPQCATILQELAERHRHANCEIRAAYVDNPEKMAKALKEYIPTLGQGLDEGDDGTKMDAGHVMFSRFGPTLLNSHPLYRTVTNQLAASLFKFEPADITEQLSRLRAGQDKETYKRMSNDEILATKSLQSFNGFVRRRYLPPTDICNNLLEFQSKYLNTPNGFDPNLLSYVFKPGFWEVFDNVFKLAKEGRLTDPRGIDMYYMEAKTKRYRTIRGSSKNEAAHFSAGSLYSAPHALDLANIKASDWAVRFNCRVSQKVDGQPQDGATDLAVMVKLDGELQAAGCPRRYPYLPSQLQLGAGVPASLFGSCVPPVPGLPPLSEKAQDLLEDAIENQQPPDAASLAAAGVPQEATAGLQNQYDSVMAQFADGLEEQLPVIDQPVFDEQAGFMEEDVDPRLLQALLHEPPAAAPSIPAAASAATTPRTIFSAPTQQPALQARASPLQPALSPACPLQLPSNALASSRPMASAVVAARVPLPAVGSLQLRAQPLPATTALRPLTPYSHPPAQPLDQQHSLPPLSSSTLLAHQDAQALQPGGRQHAAGGASAAVSESECPPPARKRQKVRHHLPTDKAPKPPRAYRANPGQRSLQPSDIFRPFVTPEETAVFVELLPKFTRGHTTDWSAMSSEFSWHALQSVSPTGQPQRLYPKTPQMLRDFGKSLHCAFLERDAYLLQCHFAAQPMQLASTIHSASHVPQFQPQQQQPAAQHPILQQSSAPQPVITHALTTAPSSQALTAAPAGQTLMEALQGHSGAAQASSSGKEPLTLAKYKEHQARTQAELQQAGKAGRGRGGGESLKICWLCSYLRAGIADVEKHKKGKHLKDSDILIQMDKDHQQPVGGCPYCKTKCDKSEHIIRKKADCEVHK